MDGEVEVSKKHNLVNITCSKSTIKALEKGVKCVQISQIKDQNDVNDGVFIVKFEHISNFFY